MLDIDAVIFGALSIDRSGFKSPNRTEIWVEISAPHTTALAANSTIVSTLIELC